MGSWPGASYDGSRRALASLKNLTSDLIGIFCGSVHQATRAAHGDGPLVRHRADVVVPAETQQEIAVLKGIAAHYVMRAAGPARPDGAPAHAAPRAVRGDLEAGERRRSTRRFRDDFDEAPDDAARTRVVIDQIASLTDASAVTRHADLVSGGSGGARGWGHERCTTGLAAVRPRGARRGARQPALRADRPRRPAGAAPTRSSSTCWPTASSPPTARRSPTLPKLRVVQTLTAGVEHIRGYVPEGVLLCNGRGIHDTSTAELALALILASLRGIPDFVRAQERAEWEPDTRPSLADKQVLIVGYGQIGEAIEARIRPFEAEVARVARSARDGVHAIDELPELLPDADVVVLIVPGTDETTGLFDAEMLARIKDGALLVNVSRGPVVDTDALLAELRERPASTPPSTWSTRSRCPADHPLWQAPNLLLVPHVGGNSTAMEPRAHRLVREQLQRFAAGEPLANVMTGDY